MGENFAIYPGDKRLISRIYKKPKQIYKKNNNNNETGKSVQRMSTDTSQKETFMQPTNI